MQLVACDVEKASEVQGCNIARSLSLEILNITDLVIAFSGPKFLLHNYWKYTLQGRERNGV
jgi:hypothetical protein